MKVILKTNVENLGRTGDVKSVRPGFARNYLLVRGLAVVATESALRAHEKSKARREAAVKKEVDAAKASAVKLADVRLSFSRKPADGDKIFGSVGKSDIVKSLKASGYTVDKDQVALEAALKQIGEHEVEIRLAPDAHAKVKVEITARG